MSKTCYEKGKWTLFIALPDVVTKKDVGEAVAALRSGEAPDHHPPPRGKGGLTGQLILTQAPSSCWIHQPGAAALIQLSAKIFWMRSIWLASMLRDLATSA